MGHLAHDYIRILFMQFFDFCQQIRRGEGRTLVETHHLHSYPLSYTLVLMPRNWTNGIHYASRKWSEALLLLGSWPEGAHRKKNLSTKIVFSGDWSQCLAATPPPSLGPQKVRIQSGKYKGSVHVIHRTT